MAYQYRYTGKNLVLVFSGVTITGDYTTFTQNTEMKIVEKTAGADTDASYNTTYKDGTSDLEYYDTGANGVTIDTATAVGQSGTLSVYPQGIGSGLPYFSYTATVTKQNWPFGFDKNTTVQVSFQKQGPMIAPIGSLQ